jgi:2-acylglycerol O-acyltransferase 2
MQSLDAHPGNYDLVLAKRKGFVKIALQTGSSLVPVLSFGETDVYDQMANAPGTKLREWQEWSQHKLGFALPFIHGRGIFNYDFGLLPHRREILTVVGDPIDVPKLADITEQDVNKYHELYMKGLQAIWDAHPDNHTKGEKLTFH